MALMPETDPIELTFDSPFAFVLTGTAKMQAIRSSLRV